MDSSSNSDSESDTELLIARIREQQELNSKVKEETKELKEQREVLLDYKEDIKYSPSDLKRNEMDIANTLSSFSSIQFGCTNLTKAQECIETTVKEDAHDDIFFPIHTGENMTFCSLSPCPGCGRIFKKSGIVHEKAFYIHCIKECAEYHDLNLIKKCDECQKLFLSARAMSRHVCNRVIPMFEGKQIAIPRAARNSRCMFKIFPCKGCGKEFKKFIVEHRGKRKGHYDEEYYIHCIRDCEEYKKLELAKVCLGCNKWFVSHEAISRHKCAIPKEDRINKDQKLFKGQVVTRPKWMPRSIFKRACYVSSQLKPKMCPGCKILIPDGEVNGNGVSSFKYIVHCIEECAEYKRLHFIRKCKLCKLKFMNPSSLTRHLKNHEKNKV